MKWIQVRIKTTEEACDAVSEMLTSIGASMCGDRGPNEMKAYGKPWFADYADRSILDSLDSDVTVKRISIRAYPEELVAEIRERFRTISRFLDAGEGYAGYETVDDETGLLPGRSIPKPFHISESVVIKQLGRVCRKKAGRSSLNWIPGWHSALVLMKPPGFVPAAGVTCWRRSCTGYRCGTGILIIASKFGASRVDAIRYR